MSRLLAESVWKESDSNLNSKNEWRGEKISRIVVAGPGSKGEKIEVSEEVLMTKIEELRNRVSREEENRREDAKEITYKTSSLVKHEKRERDDVVGPKTKRLKMDKDQEKWSVPQEQIKFHRKTSGKPKQSSSVRTCSILQFTARKSSGNPKQASY